MDTLELTKMLNIKHDSKIVMLVADGLGGLAMEPGGLTELEKANTPNMDKLAELGTSGSMYPVGRGITPGSGPGHLGLFGYDPLKYLIGRGVLEATGIGFKVEPTDVAIRCNFCTLDADGKITDRRAGRIPTEESAPLAVKLRQVSIPGVEVFVEPVKEHRFVVVFRGEGLAPNIHDTDPQETGVKPLPPVPQDAASEKTAKIAAEFVAQAVKILADQPKANGLTMRGFSGLPNIPSYEEVYGLRAAAIASYPMYKGLAQLVGMDIVGKPATIEEEVEVLAEVWDDYDFFFVHFKYTDSRGEDGDYDAKVKMIEELDKVVPGITKLGPDVLIITGDHSTPAKLAAHSWHPVPVVLSAKDCRCDPCTKFGESEALKGGFGHFDAVHLMPIALAHAGRLAKFGA